MTGHLEAKGMSSEILVRTSGQDEGIGRHASSPRTTRRRIATNLKIKSNQNCQKIKLMDV